MDKLQGAAHFSRWAELQHGVFTREQALHSGLGARTVARRVASGQWPEVFPGVYRHAATPETRTLRWMAAVLWGGPGTLLSHRAAAALYGLDGFGAGALEITTPHARARLGDLRVHKLRVLPAKDAGRHHGIPVTRPLRLLFDLAAVVDEDRLEKAVDEVLRRGWVRENLLHWALERMGGRGTPGTASFRRMLARREGTLVRTGSPEEAKFAVLFRKLGLPRPRAQHRVELPNGEERIADFAWVEQAVWVEVDGFGHHASRREWARDQARSNALVALGWRVIRFTSEDRRAPQRVRALLWPLLTGRRSA
jgi:very-short-patch-repair endonuclease